ncbi:MAG TPA: hypothetical protein VMT56_00280 [Candidatus Bathyarchaeia archaeon]|nr:hypothetical protein [Candidatus Bathyarchaeia archaeon]
MAEKQSLSIKDFKTDRDGKLSGPNYRDNIDRRWWLMEGMDICNAISATLRQMESIQKQRLAQYVVSSRLYGNLSLMGLNGMAWGRMASQNPQLRDRVSYNLVQSVIDTLHAKVAKNKPKPMFLTSEGLYSEQRRAKKMNRFCDGLFFEMQAHKYGSQAFLDDSVWGDGFVHPFKNRKGRAALERVVPTELWIDELDGLYREPTQLHRCKNVDRQVAIAAWPESKEMLERASESAPTEGTRYENVADMLTVRESWHLPSGPKAGDGMHVISINEGILFVEEWKKDYFPFVHMQRNSRLYGYFGQGLAEQLQSMQIEINKLLWTVQRSFNLGGTQHLLVKIGSKVVPEHITNDLMNIIKYAGETPPTWATPPLVQPEIFAHLERLIKAGYEQAGLTMMSAAGEKPMGVDSGKALRTIEDIEDTRFVITQQRYDEFYMELTKMSLDLVKEISGDEGGYEVHAPGRGKAEALDIKDLEWDEKRFVTQIFPVSSLPDDPAGRLQTVQEYAQAGLIDQRQVRQLLDFPDIDASESLAMAQMNLIDKHMEIMLEGSKDEPQPVLEPYDDANLAHGTALSTYENAKAGDVEEWRLERLRQYIDQATDIMQAAQQGAMMAQAQAQQAAQPQAAPEQPPTSDLLPNSPGAAA